MNSPNEIKMWLVLRNRTHIITQLCVPVELGKSSLPALLMSITAAGTHTSWAYRETECCCVCHQGNRNRNKVHIHVKLWKCTDSNCYYWKQSHLSSVHLWAISIELWSLVEKCSWAECTSMAGTGLHMSVGQQQWVLSLLGRKRVYWIYFFLKFGKCWVHQYPFP